MIDPSSLLPNTGRDIVFRALSPRRVMLLGERFLERASQESSLRKVNLLGTLFQEHVTSERILLLGEATASKILCQKHTPYSMSGAEIEYGSGRSLAFGAAKTMRIWKE